MASVLKKYFNLMILFTLLLSNVEILVSADYYPALVLINYGDGLDFPICARHSSNGTVDFTKKNSPKNLPIYYCPMTEDQRANIYDQLVDKTEYLVANSGYTTCDTEINPLIKFVKDEAQRRVDCGLTSYSELYKVGYQEQGNGQTKYKMENSSMKELYRFCFEKSGNYNFLTYIEYRIISPTLLQNDALMEERIFEYNFTDNIFANWYRGNKDLEREFNYEKYSFDSCMSDNKRKIVPITLAPPQDMPFRLLRKPFFHVLNTKPKAEYFAKQWNKIGTYIRKKAIQQLGQVKIVAGTSTVKEENGKLKIQISFDSDTYSIMWKLVYTEKEYFGMAIIFHSPYWKKQPVKLCEPSLCEDYGWTNMIPDHLKPFIYCCEPKVVTGGLNQLKTALPLRLHENFKSLYHMSESECGDKNVQVEPPLVMINHQQNSLPVCVRKFTRTNELVYSSMTDPYEEIEYYCPAGTEDAYYILETNQDGKYDNCLFKNPRKYPYCERPVQPIIIPKVQNEDQANQRCASAYEMTYQLCRTSNLYNSKLYVNSFNYPEPMYTACYDHGSGRTSYIEYRIHSPRLLKNPLLAKDSDFVEELKTDSYNIFNDDFELMKDRYTNKAPMDEVGFFMTKNFLVPPQDFAFTVWKRAAFHYVNIKLMWPCWVEVWDSINQYLRDVAMELFWEMEIKTGVLYEDDSAQSIWWKLIHLGSEKAIAIILHNVPLDTPVHRLCKPNLCERYQWKDMIPDEKKDYVYCCPSEVITDELGMDSFENVLSRNDASKVASEYIEKALLCENIATNIGT